MWALISRVKKIYGIKVNVNDRRIYLDSASRNKVVVHLSSDSRPRLLRTENEIKALDVTKTYGGVRAVANQRLIEWLAKGWIQKVGAGRNTKYIVSNVACDNDRLVS